MKCELYAPLALAHSMLILAETKPDQFSLHLRCGPTSSLVKYYLTTVHVVFSFGAVIANTASEGLLVGMICIIVVS